ncbi:hypothetical protein [Corynebacterium sp. ACRQP]|uniref:hypothetical protein n=1 Tax=Corynebacterium sp. ACRQP TaxID=2918195 RepID=UPI001EF42453|nr:hypothetical protein [Corynebacterium sp. ACRQP]MCG7236566.1 hypothetical protein [Corynebacterium sp. ACRQP]
MCLVSAVCHGPCGLLDVTLANGAKLLDGRHVTGYSWTEEKLARRTECCDRLVGSGVVTFG